MMQKRAYRLLKEWCDTLLTYQVHTQDPYTDGSLLCPACHVLHGRVADLCFPLTVLWHQTGQEHYLEAADRLIDWSEYNLKTPDELWYNDITSRWYATSAFSAMAFGETLFHYSDELPKQYREKWTGIFTRMLDALASMEHRKTFCPPTNYYCAIAAALAMGWRVTGREDYRVHARYWIDTVMLRFDSDGLLFGETRLNMAQDGSRYVDMGYNLEESLPMLLRYADLTGEHEEIIRQKFMVHMEFLLPDGAIDNSFGTRHNKWTYWGSRTSDGLIEGLALLLDDPICANACDRVLRLYEKSTHGGLLSMPMAHEVGEPTCLHHTFAHAKSLASLICASPIDAVPDVQIPVEKKYGIKCFQNDRLLLVSHGDFRATFSACNARHLPEGTSNYGSSMNLLYHDRYGVICAATSAKYSPTEILNQQYLRNAPDSPCMTAQFIVDGEMACMETDTKLTYCNTTVMAEGAKWKAEYEFSEMQLAIRLFCEEGIYQLPVVCSKTQEISVSDDGKTVSISHGPTVSSDVSMEVDARQRVFNQVGGLLYLPIRIPVKGNATIKIK